MIRIASDRIRCLHVMPKPFLDGTVYEHLHCVQVHPLLAELRETGVIDNIDALSKLAVETA